MRRWSQSRRDSRQAMRSEPRADRGPRAGSPRGVVVATGSHASDPRCWFRLQPGRYRSRYRPHPQRIRPLGRRKMLQVVEMGRNSRNVLGNLGNSVWNFTYSVWNLGNSVWNSRNSVWNLGNSVWNFAYSVWNSRNSVWNFAYSVWNLGNVRRDKNPACAKRA
jgi:hypothetical protein